MKPEPVLEHQCVLGEGPLWDFENKLICWIDIVSGNIHEYSPTTNHFRSIPVHEMIGSIALNADGNFIIAIQNGFAFLNRKNGEIKKIANPEADIPGNRFNEGKCDPSGRFWAGTMSIREQRGVGSLYMLDHDLKTIKKLKGITISNGMAWSENKKIFYYIDTPTQQVIKYDYEDFSGNISNPKAIIRIEDKEGHPDGMTIDTEGMLWIAHWGGGQVTRWDPSTGKLLLRIEMPVKKITSCTFGGDLMNDLYITSANKDLNAADLQKQPLAGSLFVIRNCGYTGFQSFQFKTTDFR